MQLSITSDYFTSYGCPQPYLRRIAEAGFTHVHWCHQWDRDFLYSRVEIEQIRQWLKEYGLQLLNLHGSSGVEKNWSSLLEYERLAGVELVRNRIEMTADLGGDVVIMHTGQPREGDPEGFWRALRRSLDELAPVVRQRGVRIAVENGDWSILETVLKEYPPDYVGLCYDCGHGNKGDGSLELLDQVKDRLIAVHLHDNDGKDDQHKPLFTGTVDWERLAGIMATSAYKKYVNLETIITLSGIEDEAQFLADAHEKGMRFSRMIDERRKLV